jgi:hypothetical protein
MNKYVLDDLKPEAIPLELVNPIVALWWADGCRRGQGSDEGEAGGGHSSAGLYAAAAAQTDCRPAEVALMFQQCLTKFSQNFMIAQSARQGDGSKPSALPDEALRPMRRPGRGDADPAPATTRQAQGEGAGLAGVGTAFCGKASRFGQTSVAFDRSQGAGLDEARGR